MAHGWIAADKDNRGRKLKRKAMAELAEKMLAQCKNNPQMRQAVMNLVRKSNGL